MRTSPVQRPPTSPRRRLETQARACEDALRRILPALHTEKRPVDRLLGMLFRDHREYGSRDRRLIGDLVFAVMRWWGWLYGLAGQPDPGAPVAVQRLTPGVCSRLLAVAALLEGEDDLPLAALWAPRLDLDWAAACREASTGDLAARGHALRRLLGTAAPARPPAPGDLVPAAWLARIESPRPQDEFIEWCQRRPPVWLRVQRGTVAAAREALARDGLAIEPHPRFDDALRITAGRASFPALAAYREGLVEVQDLASQAVGRACAPVPGQRWWDACAGGGGKSLQLARLMNGRGTVLATDVRPYKLDDVRRRAVRADLHNIVCRAWDGRPPDPRKAAFDGILIDAPCTCSGTWRRNPDARWRTTAADLDELPRTQAAILDAVAAALKPGGVLVYATCSVFACENREAVAGFLARHPEYAPQPFPNPLTGAPTDGTLQIWPWDGDGDAMFVARLQRTGPAGPPSSPVTI